MEEKICFEILPAEWKDLPKILELQYLAYQSEAILVGDDKIPPLTQTIEELRKEFAESIILKASILGSEFVEEIVGSVRATKRGSLTNVGRLMVAPEFQCRGIGTALLTRIEEMTGDGKKELFTSSLSLDNIRLYEKNGYQIFKSEKVRENLEFVYLSKNI